ncbi:MULTISPECIES: DUF433 domain-containing protein [Thermomonospora]|uniref:Uncharacterized protein (DUF433 family) n=1 Tax=Thermomonospora cellulosilytica TaxID=1411118 RepID=A0A7W3MXC6_9ACTN|nr:MULTISPECIES: DUF433 domain-containing protein [Thermomonospora]MBA9003648.1 uncharacterized protein (DUF433 family) [Thermomonospora cellulosilytica]
MTEDLRFTSGLLNMSDAARYLGIPPETLRRWARGDESGGPILHALPPADRQATVTFISLAEAYVLEALRDAGVNPRKIRPALKRLQKEFSMEYVLVARELATDGIDVLWDFARTREGEGLIEARTGQRVMREIVEDYLQYLHWGADEFPQMMELRRFHPSKVVVDPHRSFGQPFFAGSRTRVADVAALLKAGEDPEVIVDELGVSPEDVRSAARVVLGGHAA